MHTPHCACDGQWDGASTTTSTTAPSCTHFPASHAHTSRDLPHHQVEDGLVLLTGGMARSIEAAAAEPDALWQEMMGAWTGGAVIGCRAGVAGNGAAGDPAAVGLQPAETYCAVTGGEMPPGKMVRLRAFHGSPEWRGRWALPPLSPVASCLSSRQALVHGPIGGRTTTPAGPRSCAI